ncbi:M23 family metallopeptidase [Spirochaeta isovalerica]|uniref:Murein DD-endopeptidase MepM/ murein hydrolase activator NlpD n=1 Tax=Spirochaeta isovalerica TaxID=150 RepID=A0A841RC95_9SPIO|nr:M23 family metallopeptidase [Spirochaeta isovalerica]MBB6480847.1 murein DD-endopeptidase MepM/ murein hydrolase activator NlpD [Spirochaeta isovalerica]
MRDRKKKDDNLLSMTSRRDNFFVRFIKAGRRKLTVMFIPHSEEKVVNIQISLFTLVFSGVFVLALLGAFFWFSTHYTGNRQQLMASRSNLRNSEASLEVVREEIDSLMKVAGSFNETLSKTLTSLGIDSSANESLARSQGDLSDFVNMIETDSNSNNEVGDLKKLRMSLDNSIEPLNEITDVLLSQKALLTDIPTLWPLKGVRGRVTNPYGPAIHPFTGEWYLHKGLDLGYGMGQPIVATANGKVTLVDYEKNGFGHYMVIQHKYGFDTKYAHMQNIYVKEGQEVKQGDVIGTMGNSGLSDGPHLHYEVRIGSQVLDPAKFINMTDNAYEVIKWTIEEYK